MQHDRPDHYRRAMMSEVKFWQPSDGALTSRVIAPAPHPQHLPGHRRSPAKDRKENPMPDAQDIATRYLACWNERDPERRRALVAALWADDGTYRDPMAATEGHDGIADLIGGVQTRFPGFTFAQSGRADAVEGFVRFSWSFGPHAGEAPVAGTDFAALAPDGRLRAVTGFLDRVPEGA
jgi:hypothetical protein